MAEIKMSKKNVFSASLLICVLATTLIALHITSASPSESAIEITRIFPVTYPTWDPTWDAADFNSNLTFAVAVNNTGTEPENFTLTIYNGTNGLTIATKNVTLSGETEEIVKFTLKHPALPGYPYDPFQAWLPGYPTHRIWAEASNVSNIEDEYDTTENVTVTVRWPGDADGDGHVNQTDLDMVVSLFGKNFPDPEYDPRVDFNCDGGISILDINIVTAVERHYHNGPLDSHDIAVTGIFPVTYPTWDPSQNLTFAVTVKNKGISYNETFDVTIYNDTTPIGNKTVTNLAPRTEEIVKFTLKHPSMPEYPDNSNEELYPYDYHEEISAKAFLLNETLTDDNSYNQPVVTVRWPGDADGDGHVNQTDLDMVVSLFGKNFPDPEYDPRVDFNCDGRISFLDITIAAIYPNQHNGPLDYADIQIGYVTLRLPNQPLETVSVAYSNSTYSSWTINTIISVINNGNNTESCTIVAYYRLKESNEWIVIGNTSVTVAANDSEPATIPWEVPTIDGKPYSEYEIKANATVLEWEDEPSAQGNNEKEGDGTVTIRWIGDATNNYKVDIEDLRMLRNAIGSYNIEVDFNGNGEIDLDDVAQLTDNWGQVPKA
jgi:hypothetical protein